MQLLFDNKLHTIQNKKKIDVSHLFNKNGELKKKYIGLEKSKLLIKKMGGEFKNMSDKELITELKKKLGEKQQLPIYLDQIRIQLLSMISNIGNKLKSDDKLANLKDTEEFNSLLNNMKFTNFKNYTEIDTEIASLLSILHSRLINPKSLPILPSQSSQSSQSQSSQSSQSKSSKSKSSKSKSSKSKSSQSKK